MTALLVIPGAAVMVVLVATAAWRIWHLDRRVMEEVDGELNHLWNEMMRAHRAHAVSTARRVEQVEATVARTARSQHHQAWHVDWVESWVRHWVAGPPNPDA